MSERTETSAEEALILITCACTGADRVRAFLRQHKIRPTKRATITDAILARYRTRAGYGLRRFAAEFRLPAPIVEMAV